MPKEEFKKERETIAAARSAAATKANKAEKNPEAGPNQERSPHGVAWSSSNEDKAYLPLLLRPSADFVAKLPFSVLSKMLVGFLLVVLLLLGMAILSLVVIRQMDRQVDDLNLLQEKVSRAQQMIYLITAQSHYRTMALLTGDESYNAQIAAAKQEFLGHLDAVERISPPEQRQFFSGVREANDRFAASSAKVLELSEAGSLQAAMRLHLDEEHPVSHELEAAMRELISDSQGQMLGAVAEFQSQRRLLNTIVAIFSGVGLISALFIGFVLSLSFFRPVRQIDIMLRQVAGGDFTPRVEVPNQDELGTLSHHFNRMVAELAESYGALEQARDAAETLSTALQNELDKGWRLQQDFLPHSLPQPPGWELGAVLYPARDVSGDFYDAFTVPGGLVAIAIGDVCDKGVGSAFFMALYRSLIRIFCSQTHLIGQASPASNQPTKPGSPVERQQADLSSPTSILKAIGFANNYIIQNHGETNIFVTVFFGVLDPATGLLSYINAGHEPPAILGRAGVKARLVPTGPAVGIIPDVDFEISQVQLEAGDILIAYTDGVTDARNQDRQFFTETKLLTLLEQSTPSAVALLDHLENSVRAHIGNAVQFDDITMLALRRVPIPN
jgi:serine phosphatase RsbU (regulator of sigma subunit)/CHASE3 domain sensor protein